MGVVVEALVGAGVGATVELPEGGVGAMVGAALWVRGGGEELVLLSSFVDASCVVVWRERERVWIGRVGFGVRDVAEGKGKEVDGEGGVWGGERCS